MLLIYVLLAATAAPRPFTEERDLLDRRLAAVRRALPDGVHGAPETKYVQALADRARLRVTSMVARPPTESANRGELLIDFVALGRFTHVETFFREVVQAQRLVDVVSIALTATPEDTIRVTAVLRLPYWPDKARLPAPPEGTSERSHGAPRTEVERFARDQALLVAKTEALEDLRRTRRNPRLFLSELAACTQDRPVILTEVSWGDELFVIRGLTMGEGPSRALSRRLERGYFRVSEFLMARQAGCRRFEARGRCPIAGSDIELPVARDDPFRQEEAPCRVDRDGPDVKIVRGAGAKAKTAPGPLTIRAREMDAADLFQVLHELTGYGFVVEEEVHQRLSADLVGMTLDEVIATLAKSQIYVSAGGAVRRVSASPLGARPNPTPAPAPTTVPTAAPTATTIASATPTPAKETGDATPTPGGYSISLVAAAAAAAAVDAAATASPTPVPPPPPEEPSRISLSVKRATVRDLLGALAQADPTVQTQAPAGTLGHLSVFAREVDTRVLRAAVLEAADMTEVAGDDGRRSVLRTGAPPEAVTPVEPVPPLRRLALRPSDLSPDDFEMAGIGGNASGWRAFAYSPSGSLHPYRSGDTLAYGALKSVDATSVILEGEDGPIWVRLTPLP